MGVISDEFFDTLENTQLLKNKKKEITPILQLVKQFFKKRKIVLYGGTAINMYLPAKDRFYSDLDIPDYDGFHFNAEKQSLNLLKYLKSMNFDFLMVKYAIHDGTYKISWAFKDVADISQMNKYEYDKILRTSIKKDDFYLCNINLLKSNAYVELAMPKSCLFRWAKVYKRLMLLEKHYPNNGKTNLQSVFTDKLETPIDDIVEKTKSLLIKRKYPFVGIEAVHHYCGEPALTNTNNQFYLIEILSDNIFDTVTRVEKLLGTMLNMNEQHIEYQIVSNKKSQIIPESIDIVLFDQKNTYKFLRIYDVSNKCVAVEYNSKTQRIYGSIFFLLHVYYYKIFITSLKKKKEFLSIIIEALFAEIDKKHFTMNCYGVNKSLSAIKKSRYLKNKPAVLAKA